MEKIINTLKMAGFEEARGGSRHKKIVNGREYDCIDMRILINTDDVDVKWIDELCRYCEDIDRPQFKNYIMRSNYTMNVYFYLSKGENSAVYILFRFERNTIELDYSDFNQIFIEEIREHKIKELLK